jgi:hypothetical protein
MSKIRVQVITRRATDLAADHIVNTVHFDDFNVSVDGTDWQAFANDVREVFRTGRGGFPAGYGIETKVYNMADAMPRPIKATGAWQQGASSSPDHVPREVALCLSYYSERNLPRFRGRIFIGPWMFAAERPNDSQRTGLMTLATQLGAVGGIDVDWGLWSPTRAAFSKITNVWVDDEWDTIRSRGKKATNRMQATTSE